MELTNEDKERIENLLSLNSNTPQFQVLKDYLLPFAIRVQSIPLIDKFIAAGTDVNKPNNKGITPLYGAIETHNMEIIQKIISAGADVNKEVSIVIGHDEFSSGSSYIQLKTIPLNKAVEINSIDIVNKLIDAGADIYKQIKSEYYGHSKRGPRLSRTEKYTVMYEAFTHDNIPMIKNLLEKGYEINEPIYEEDTLLKTAIIRLNTNILNFLLEQPGLAINVNINQFNTPINFYITRIRYLEFTNEHKTILAKFIQYPGLDKEKLLAKIESATETGEYSNEISEFIIEHIGQSNVWEGWTKSDISQLNDIFSETIPANSLTKPYNANDPKVKSGEVPETMVESLFSFCPICLKYIKHEAKSCMYMSHDCRKNPNKFYHKKLYEKYAYFKSDNFGRLTSTKIVTWCTLCGRICKEHQHYPLTSYTSPTPGLLPGGNPYETDCRKTNGGGGYPEKIWRYQKLREFAYQLNQLKGQLTKKEAYERLVEAMWDAPLQQKGLQNLAMTLGKTNIRPNVKTYEWSPGKTEMNVKPVGCFGKTCKQSKPSNVRIGPINWRKTARNKVINRHTLWQEKKGWSNSLEFPNPVTNNGAQPISALPPYTGELPIVHTVAVEGWSNFMGIDDDTLVQFRHTKADGILNKHDKPGEQISQAGLTGILKSRLGNPGSEEFGKCWQFYTAAQQQQLSDEQKSHVCTANLHPDEVDAALDLTDEEHKQLAKNYRTAYTNRFTAATGGKRRRKTRKFKNHKRRNTTRR